jgi:hypothetical protein
LLITSVAACIVQKWSNGVRAQYFLACMFIHSHTSATPDPREESVFL